MEVTHAITFIVEGILSLLHMQQIDGVKIMHGRNGREVRVSEMGHFNLDVYCPETRKIYEFFGCYCARSYMSPVP